MNIEPEVLELTHEPIKTIYRVTTNFGDKVDTQIAVFQPHTQDALNEICDEINLQKYKHWKIEVYVWIPKHQSIYTYTVASSATMKVEEIQQR